MKGNKMGNTSHAFIKSIPHIFKLEIPFNPFKKEYGGGRVVPTILLKKQQNLVIVLERVAPANFIKLPKIG